MSVTVPQSAVRKVVLNVSITLEPDACWTSNRGRSGVGYAQIHCKGDDGLEHTIGAHRVAWVAAHGQQIPEDRTVDHICKNTACIRPSHLRLLTNEANARRTGEGDWPLDECRNGHKVTGVCHTCREEYLQRWHAERRHQCLDCPAEIAYRSTRCRSCARKAVCR